jgi:hypothetical protein
LSLFARECQDLIQASIDALAIGEPGLDERLVISGRVLDARCNAVKGASIEASFADNATTSTDADGRFMLVIDRRSTAAAQAVPLHVTHPQHRARVARVGLTQRTHVAHDALAPLARDEAGAWRGALSLVLT